MDEFPEAAAVEKSGLKEGIRSLMVASVVQPVRIAAIKANVRKELKNLIFMGGGFGMISRVNKMP
jgi:hypothetical protein